MKRLVTGAILLLVISTRSFAVDPQLLITQYGHTAWRTRDGAFAGSVTAITQTSDGYLWIATSAGLLRFDGVRFEPWRPPEGTSIASIVALLGALDGSLWIGTSSGLLRWKNQRLAVLANTGFFGSLLQDRDGTIWAGHTRSSQLPPLCRFAAETFRCIGSSDGLPLKWVEALHEDAHGSLWVGGDGGACTWSGSVARCVPIPGLAQFADKFGVSAIATDAGADLWAAAGSTGIWHHVSSHWVHEPGLGSTIESEAMLRDREGGLWIGGQKDGLFRRWGSRTEHFTTADGLSGDRVTALFEDAEGNVWSATNGGLDRFRDLAVVTLTKREGLLENDVASVASSNLGGIWVANHSGLVHLAGGTIGRLTVADGLPPGQLTSVVEDSRGQLWVGINDGLFRKVGSRFTPVRMPDGSPVGVVRVIAEDTDHDIWLATTRREHALVRIKGLTVDQVIGLDEIGTGGVSVIQRDPAGGLWLGSNVSGVVHYRDHVVAPLRFKSGGSFRNMLVDDHGLWITTTAGVYLVKGDRVWALGRQTGLPCDTWPVVAKSDDGAFWLRGSCGIVRIATAQMTEWLADPRQPLQFQWYDASDGAQSDVDGAFQPQAARSDDGRMWFAVGRVGVQVVDVTRAVALGRTLPTYVTRVTADRHSYDPSGPIELASRTRDLEIDYTALSFAVPEKVRFRYRLDGFDKEWQEAETRRAAFYTNLAPGTYRFQVMASNSYGVWASSAATATLSIKPAFYQTNWFIVVSGVSILSMMYLLYAFRVRRLTALVRGRMEERLAERERIARELHDTLLQSTYGLMLQFQAIADQMETSAPVRSLLEDALDRGDKAVVEARNRVEGLRTAEAAGVDLPTALKSIGAELTAGNQIELRVVVDGQRRDLNAIVGDEAFWIAREALFNAFRESRARHIDVELTYGRRELRLRVIDDGQGFDPTVLRSGGKPKHWGIRGMRERASRIGGKFRIATALGAGTEVDLRVPHGVAYRRESRGAIPWLRRFAHWRRATST
jgi:signal transduction histidine kinase/ligand-binding sensor domain-containing protein